MQVTKLVHSCLLIKHNDRKILVDPGNYSWQDEAVQATDFTNVAAVVVTHGHPDHIDPVFAQAVLSASPDAAWYAPEEVVVQLSTLGITGNTQSDDADIRFIQSSHADLSPWFSQQPQHTSYMLFGTLLVSGDCQTLTSMHGARILAAAINGGPWGAVVGFTKMIATMADRPDIVLPLHDWHWNESARAAIYDRLPYVLSEYGIEFMPLSNCKPVELT